MVANFAKTGYCGLEKTKLEKKNQKPKNAKNNRMQTTAGIRSSFPRKPKTAVPTRWWTRNR